MRSHDNVQELLKGTWTGIFGEQAFVMKFDSIGFF